MKDTDLDLIAERGFNVARFISAAPNGDVRHVRISKDADAATRDFRSAVRNLFASGVASVNIRCFRPTEAQGNPFHYGIPDPDAAVSLSLSHLADGYYVIVNETVDVNDGGISGVCEGGVWEFAPGATPRVVESGDVCRLASPIARRIVETVYGSAPDLDDSAGQRVEFSVHPSPVGYRSSRTLVWEISDSSASGLHGPIVWPNPFSRHLGDKVFGLLIADAIGLPVPMTLAIPRNIAPFQFGTDTGGPHTWTRTAPIAPRPGLFTTVRGWTDIFLLLAAEDPGGHEIAAVLHQQGVQAGYSGAAIPRSASSDFLIEGVRGEGDLFMLGDVAPTELPAQVASDVKALLSRATDAIGPVRIEWVHDGTRAWVVQLHLARQSADPGVFHPGSPTNGWLMFKPSDGLPALTEVIKQARVEGRGVRVLGPVGVTSHVGDLLRRAAVPSVVEW